jgi:hypothetical protein
MYATEVHICETVVMEPVQGRMLPLLMLLGSTETDAAGNPHIRAEVVAYQLPGQAGRPGTVMAYSS